MLQSYIQLFEILINKKFYCLDLSINAASKIAVW